MNASSGAGTFPTPEFTRFWTAEAVSGFGTYVSLLALQLVVVVTLDGSVTQVGWLNATRWLPYLVIGLVIGALVDRRRRRPLMISTDVVRAVLLATIPLAHVLGVLSFTLLVVVVAVFGTASLVNDAASMSYLPRLTHKQHLQRAHARIDGTDAVAQTSGPALSGALVGLVGAPFTVLMSAATYLVSALAVATIRTAEPAARVVNKTRGLRREIREGIAGLYGRPGLARLAVSTHVWFVANATLGVVLVPFAVRELGLSAFELGVITGAGGVGAIGGAMMTTAAGRRLGTGGAIVTAYALSSIGALVMALAGLGTSGTAAATVLGAGSVLHGFGMGMSNSHQMSYQQILTPDGLQARVNITMRSANRAVIVVVAPLAGLVADGLGMRPALVGAAVVFAAATLLLAVAPSLRADPEA